MDILSQWCKEDLSDGKMSYLFYCSMWTCCKLTIENFLIAIQTFFHMGIGCIFSFNYWILFHLRFWKELCLRPTNGGGKKSVVHVTQWKVFEFVFLSNPDGLLDTKQCWRLAEFSKCCRSEIQTLCASANCKWYALHKRAFLRLKIASENASQKSNREKMYHVLFYVSPT